MYAISELRFFPAAYYLSKQMFHKKYTQFRYHFIGDDRVGFTQSIKNLILTGYVLSRVSV